MGQLLSIKVNKDDFLAAEKNAIVCHYFSLILRIHRVGKNNPFRGNMTE